MQNSWTIICIGFASEIQGSFWFSWVYMLWQLNWSLCITDHLFMVKIGADLAVSFKADEMVFAHFSPQLVQAWTEMVMQQDRWWFRCQWLHWCSSVGCRYGIPKRSHVKLYVYLLAFSPHYHMELNDWHISKLPQVTKTRVTSVIPEWIEGNSSGRQPITPIMPVMQCHRLGSQDPGKCVGWMLLGSKRGDFAPRQMFWLVTQWI